MENIGDIKISSLGDSNYVKPLRMHYTQVYYYLYFQNMNTYLEFAVKLLKY